MNWSNFFDGLDSFQFKNSELVAGVFDTDTPLISVYGRGDVGATYKIINKEPSHKFSDNGIKKLMRARMLNIPCIDLVGWEDKEYILYHGNYLDIKKYINDISNVTIITPNAAKNFPNTTPTMFTGDVSINCSVPVFLSSAIVLIVSIGTIKVNIVAPE